MNYVNLSIKKLPDVALKGILVLELGLHLLDTKVRFRLVFLVNAIYDYLGSSIGSATLNNYDVVEVGLNFLRFLR